MGQKLVIGPINKGLRTDRTAFNIDDDSFPVLENAYQWRGRLKRKRGSAFLNRLQRYFSSASTAYGTTSSINLSATSSANLLSGFSLQTGGNIVPGTITLTNGAQVYTDPNNDGTLTGSSGGTGTINYQSGGFTITGGSGAVTLVSFWYYPVLPVMGIEDLILLVNQYPQTLAFDTIYAYNVKVTAPYMTYDVSFYKNPPSGSGFTTKTIVTPLTWNSQSYQQTWTVNYEGALWATNGITVPFSITNIGMSFAQSSNGAGNNYISVANRTGATTVDFTISNNVPLVIGDFVFANEFAGTSGSTLNFQTGYVTNIAGNVYTVTFPNASIGAAGLSGGILQYLTNRSDVTKDCLRWYDGDPTNGAVSPNIPALTSNNGWVNFMPPLSQAPFSISGLPAKQYYLVGARMITPFKDRLVFSGAVIQASTGSPIYLQDTMIWSQNGTPYYTASFNGNILSLATTFNPLLTPTNQGASPAAYYIDQTGFGDFLQAGVDQPINSNYPTRDVLIVGFQKQQSRFVATNDDIRPFDLHTVNSEYGTSSIFSGVVTDEGVFTRGSRGFVITNENSCDRFDLPILDQVFEINLSNNGAERICAQRDFINEWIYFTYVSNQTNGIFPSQTLQFNYRDNSWATFDESFTTYGLFTPSTGSFTWSNIGNFFPTWDAWDVPWNAGSTTVFQPQNAAGNQQGFLFMRDEGTDEPTSLIANFSSAATITGATQATQCVLTAANQFVVGQTVTISGVVGMTQLNGNTYTISAVTPTTITINVNSSAFTAYISGGTATPNEPVYSPNHGLNGGDYFIISGATGSIAYYNGLIFSANSVTTNGFQLNPNVTFGSYFGEALLTRMYVPFIQSKQFPIAWDMARKTRIGSQQYLITTTPAGQITLQIYLSQDAANNYNELTGVNANNAVIYSTTVFTCPESTNLGLTPANINLNLVTAASQQQTWHRMNTSLVGDTVQLGFTLNDEQMRAMTPSTETFAITGATNATTCVLSTTANYPSGTQIYITGVGGMTQLNGNQYTVLSSTPTTATIGVDSTLFGTYTSGGTIASMFMPNQFSEIEIHSMILDINASQLLA